MNIWVEYWKIKTIEDKNYYAQSRPIKWEEPNKEDIHVRFCQSREAANKFAQSMQDRGHHARIKTDGY